MRVTRKVSKFLLQTSRETEKKKVAQETYIFQQKSNPATKK